MQHELRRLVIGSKAFLTISEQEYLALREAKTALRAVLDSEEKFSILIENYIELETTILNEATINMVIHNYEYNNFQHLRALISRRILNYLSSVRLYLDSLKGHAETILAPDQEALARTLSLPSEKYDSSLAYRVIEALRNYTQHYALPVHVISVENKWENQDDLEKQRMACSITPRMRIASLEEDGKFKSGVLKELKSQGEYVDLMPAIRQHVESISEIHSEFRIVYSTQENALNQLIESTIRNYESNFPSEGVIGLAAVKKTDSVTSTDPIPLLRETAEYRAYLKNRTRLLRKISRRYVKY